MRQSALAFVLCLALVVPACGAVAAGAGSGRGPRTLRVATTTSTADTGLLDAILPAFEKANTCRVDVVAVGTGQAIAIGRMGDADVLLVHDRAAEDRFVAEGFARGRFDVMYNDYVVVGPKDDPAKAAGKRLAAEAFKAIMDKQSVFVSRGDRSGTHAKELSIWSVLGVTPTREMAWYYAIGQGMGDALIFAHERKGYTLTDRGTWLAMRGKLPDLAVVVGGNSPAENTDTSLLNPYGVMAVNPDKQPAVNSDLAVTFVQWILSPETQRVIAGFGVETYGQPLFYPGAR